jgi:hypothetical protein
MDSKKAGLMVRLLDGMMACLKVENLEPQLEQWMEKIKASMKAFQLE